MTRFSVNDPSRVTAVDGFIKVSIGLMSLLVLSLWSWTVLAVSTVASVGGTSEDPVAAMSLEARRDRWAEQTFGTAVGRSDHGTLKQVLDQRGLVQPSLASYDQIDLPPATRVIGVSVRGTQHAFVLEAMQNDATPIVNLLFQSTPLSVVHCSISGRTRVLTQSNLAWPIALRDGGRESLDQLVLLLAGARYSVHSQAIPLVNYPFERTTLAEWHQRFPHSDYFVGKLRCDENLSLPEYEPVAVTESQSSTLDNSPLQIVSHAAEAAVVLLRRVKAVRMID